jgi:hypothetical protein
MQQTTRKPRKKNYINNADLLIELQLSREKKKMTEKLAAMLQELCARYARKGNFVNYTWREDMEAYAMMMLVRSWDKFKPEVSDNPFAFFTQCVKNFFRQYLNHEKKHRDIRDELMVHSGLTPSFRYQMEHGSDGDNVVLEEKTSDNSDESGIELESL